ncbi:MAG: sensor histidine kinase [Actinomycetales bacterium]
MWRPARTFWREPRPAPIPRPSVTDTTLAGLVLAAGGIELTARLATAPADPGAVTAMGPALLVIAAMSAAVLMRRTQPALAAGGALLAIAAADALSVASGRDPLTLSVGLLVLVLTYSLGRWAGGRELILTLPFTAGGFAVIVLLDGSSAAETVAGAAVLTVTVTAGLAVRYWRAAQLQLVERAKAAEREQLARELHDTVAHHVSAIAIQAQAGLIHADTDPAAARQALAVIDDEAATTLAQMRSIVRSLRTSEVGSTGHQDLSSLHRLTQGPGPRVRLSVAPDLESLPDTVQTTIFRVVQEALTNARRHARQAEVVQVKVDQCTDGSLLVTVTDDGRPGPAQARGYGLIGMAERVSLLGGTLEAGPLPSGGWQVRARLADHSATSAKQR